MENTTKQQDMHLDVLQNGIGNAKEELHRQSKGASAPEHDFDLLDGASATVIDKHKWYAHNLNNNNNALGALASNKEIQCDATATLDAVNKKLWSCELCKSLAAIEGSAGLVSDCGGGGDGDSTAGEYAKILGVKENVSSLTIPDKGGGGGLGAGEAVALLPMQNGSSAKQSAPMICKHFACLSTTIESQNPLSPELSTGCLTAASNYVLAGAAASLTPPANSNSNRTSINNSTDNLSYSSDNCYVDELIVLQDTISADDDLEIDDEEAEKISMYSDDCVYAYRGEGADYDLGHDTIHNRGHFVDDETDFLEMDFEPDPLSEVECGSMEAANNFLMQRDNCISLAPSSNTTLVQRQLYNSPIENMPQLQKGGLHNQSSLLSKNFSRIALHLDQIKSEESPTPDTTRCESSSLTATVIENAIESAESQSHSLPNSLLANFGRDLQEKQQEERASPSKVTGAKPKRLNTFSTSSSTSSKISSKSRTSVRSIAFNSTGLCSSNSFDERSVSCTDFRCNPSEDISANSVTANVALTFNDETCLDCLEKEFLANTIGKAVDFNQCPKCQKRRTFNTAAYGENLCHTQLKSTSLCYDFNDPPNSDCLFQANEFFEFNQRNEKRHKNFSDKLNQVSMTPQRLRVDYVDKGNLLIGCSVTNQRSTCDILNEKQLLKDVLTEKEIVTISTNNINEDVLVQALDKLKVPYNIELIKTHFKPEYYTHKVHQGFKSFKHFILSASKKNCNHPRLKRLIEMVTRGQVEASFKKDTHITQTEMVQVKVIDILNQWTYTNNIELLKQLDRRFQEANVLGKIANIIRQAQQRCTPRRPIPEFISIPQYYASGYLKLIKKC